MKKTTPPTKLLTRKKGEGHIRIRHDKHGNPKYQMIIETWKDGILYRKARTLDTKDEAEQWGKHTLYEIHKGIVTKETLRERTLREAIDLYVQDMLPPGSAADVTRHLKWWNARIGHLYLSEITPKLLTDYKNELLTEPTHRGKKRANATVRYYLISLQCVFQAAIKDWFWINENPVLKVRKPPIANHTSRESLTPNECRLLLDACKESRNPYLYYIVLIALGTGMRRGEILGLRWENIDFQKNLIRLKTTKNGSPHTVPMTRFVTQTLKNLFEKERVGDLSYEIFPRLNKRPLDIRTAFNFALKRVNLKRAGIVFHSLRHTCRTLLAESGATVLDAMKITNHQDVRSSQTYNHPSTDHLRKILERATEKVIEPSKAYQ